MHRAMYQGQTRFSLRSPAMPGLCLNVVQPHTGQTMVSEEKHNPQSHTEDAKPTGTVAAVIGAVVFLGLPLFGGGAYWIALQSTAQKLADSTDAAGLSVNAEGHKMLPFGDFEVPRKGAPSNSDSKAKANATQDDFVTLRLLVGISPNSPELEKEILARHDELRETAQAIVTENGWNNDESVASRLALRTALVSAINGILKTGEIQIVAFSEIVSQ